MKAESLKSHEEYNSSMNTIYMEGKGNLKGIGLSESFATKKRNKTGLKVLKGKKKKVGNNMKNFEDSFVFDESSEDEDLKADMISNKKIKSQNVRLMGKENVYQLQNKNIENIDTTSKSKYNNGINSKNNNNNNKKNNKNNNNNDDNNNYDSHNNNDDNDNNDNNNNNYNKNNNNWKLK